MKEVEYILNAKVMQSILDYLIKRPYEEVRNIMIPIDKIVMDANAEWKKESLKDKK